MERWKIRQANSADQQPLAALRTQLWPEGPQSEHLSELEGILRTGVNGTLPMAIMVAEDQAGTLIGFLEVGLRSHADGCDSSRPVGYVEGWYVVEPHRKHRIGRALMQAAESWALEQGCREMASDALIENEISHAAHKSLGFAVVDCCITFRKPL